MVPKRGLACFRPYLGKSSLDLKTRLWRTIERNLLFCKLKIIFRSKCRLTNVFHFKDSLDKNFCSEIMYCFTCSNCKVTYYLYQSGRTHGYLYSYKKTSKNVKQSAISDHLLQCNCTINFDDFDILAAESNKFKLLLRESLLLKRDKPILNTTIKSFPLELFD